MTVLLTRVPPSGRMRACFVFPMNAIEMPLTYRFIPTSSTNLRSWCPQIAATPTQKLPGFSRSAQRTIREFKQIATAGATTAAVTEKVWGEYVSLQNRRICGASAIQEGARETRERARSARQEISACKHTIVYALPTVRLANGFC